MAGVWDNLVTSILGLPGVGPKMAERIALHLLRKKDCADFLQRSLTDAQTRMRRCLTCGDYMETTSVPAPCARCLDPHRDTNLLCVVEETGDLAALERSRAFRGGYHVLGGVLSALDGIGPEELRIESLLHRVRENKTDEVILATNPTVEGETTAAYLADLLKSAGVRVTRLAAGLPSGSAIQYADEHTLAQAVTGRRDMN
jgi:recombination protein RecR